MTPRLAFLAAVVAATACTAHFGGALEVDGQPFELLTCHSGQALGFSGVELVLRALLPTLRASRV